MKMKKIVLLFLSVMMAFCLCACSGKGVSAGKAKKIVDDTSVMAMSFTCPDAYESVERYSELDKTGKLIEKDITYNLPEGKILGYAYSSSVDVASLMDLSSLESLEQGGQTCYFYPYGDDTYVFVPVGEDLYAIDYTGDIEELKEIVKSISFTNVQDTITDDTELGDISFTFEDEDKVYAHAVRVLENKAGEIERKSVQYYFGEDDSNQEYRIFFSLHKNAKIEDLIDPDRTYEERTINGTTYTAHISDNYDKPYNYYTQHGNDVYQIVNNGTGGWFVDRSEESFEALEAILNTVSFR